MLEPVLLNRLLTLDPKKVMETRQTTTMSASKSAYSTMLAPSSDRFRHAR